VLVEGELLDNEVIPTMSRVDLTDFRECQDCANAKAWTDAEENDAERMDAVSCTHGWRFKAMTAKSSSTLRRRNGQLIHASL
jgi:hypothetical protein